MRRPAADRDESPEGDGGDRRRCLVSGVVGCKEALLRFVIDPRGRVVADIDERLGGRGFWLSARRDVLERACVRNLFAKAARAEVTAGPDLVDQVERLLTRRCLDLIGLARRSGQVVCGFDGVRERLRLGRCGAVLAAADGAAGGRAKVRALAAGAPVVDVLTSAELGSAVGRERMVHMAVERGRLADRLVREAARLAGFRPAAAGDAGDGA